MNRRQRDDAERDALARYRQGQVTESQAIRTEHGWEHDCQTPTATRDALAAALVADVDALGANNVVALTVSHADAEDLADRVRAVRRARGELSGPSMAGPGSGSEDRHYAAGDLVLVHATLRLPGRRLHNGTVLTVTGVTDAGLTVSGGSVSGGSGDGLVLPVDFVTGRRRDGAPNVSHALARTVDGAEGGTWERVHLLGTAALDRYSAYVGQSRGRSATHTWNVSRIAAVDHGGVVVTRDPAEEVLAAMEREPTIAFAAHDDPYALDRILNTERDEHVAVIATRPPMVSTELVEARRRQKVAEDQATSAERRLRSAEAKLASIGPLARLRREGRRQADQAETRVTDATQGLARAEADHRSAITATESLEAMAAAHRRWFVEHGWRLTRTTEIGRQLALHWTDAVVVATRQGDPLAFGIEALRQARSAVVADLRGIEAALPPDHAAPLARAEDELAHRTAGLAHARSEVTKAEGGVEAAAQRRWGRRDQDAIGVAQAAAARARSELHRAEEWVASVAAEVEVHGHSQARRAEALEDTAAERGRLGGEARELADALDETRVHRVLAAARGEPERDHLVVALGPAPSHPGARLVWCGIAAEVEARRDRVIEDAPMLAQTGPVWLLGPRPDYITEAWDRTAVLVSDAPELLRIATRTTGVATEAMNDPQVWRRAVVASVDVLEAARPTRETPDRSIGVGW